jgi:hypothetical protein
MTGAPYDYLHPTPFTVTLVLTDAAVSTPDDFAKMQCASGHVVAGSLQAPPTQTKPPASTGRVAKCAPHQKSTKRHPCRKR